MRTIRHLLLALALLAVAAGALQAQPKLTLIGFDPPTQTATNLGSAVIRFNVTNTPANRCDVTFFRDDGASTLVAGLTPGTGPFSVTVPLPRGVDGKNVIFTGIVQDTVSGSLSAGDRQLSIIADDVAPQPPTILSPSFPATVNGNTLTVQGRALHANGTPETSGTIIITAIDPPNAGNIIGAGAIRADGAWTATADLSAFTTGVLTNIGFRAEDAAGNKSTVLQRQVTKAQLQDPTISNATMDPPDGTLTNNPAVLIRGTVTGNGGPFTVYFLVDGFVESQVSGLSSGENFTHTLTLATDGVHTISLRAQNNNALAAAGAVRQLGKITLDRVAPSAPVIVEPNPVGPMPIVTGVGFTVRGFSGERSPSSTSTARPVVLAAGPPNVSFAPASPLAIDQGTGEFRTQVNVANLEDGQHRLTFTCRDAAGNIGPSSTVDVYFVKDTRPPTIDEVRINGIVAPQINPEIYVGRASVAIQIKTNEDLVGVPRMQVIQHTGSALPAGVSSNTARVFNYSYGAIPGFDGPVGLQVSDGKDRAGNALTAALSRMFIVDTTPPEVTSVTPRDASSMSVSPVFIRVTFRDPPSAAGTASGPDLTRSQITLEGPLGSSSATIAGTMTQFDPFTLDLYLTSPLTQDGTYRVRVLAVDKVDNRSEKFNSTFVLDKTPIQPTEANVLSTPKHGTCVNATSIPGGAATPFVTVRLTDPQVDLARSTVVVRDFCRVPPEIPGTAERVTPDSIKFTFAGPLATNGSNDGQYAIGVTMRDQAGNVSPEFTRTFTYDTLNPSVQATYPTSESAISGPLRAVDATLFDPRYDACRERCGIDRTSSTTELALFLVTPNPNTNRRRGQAMPFKIPGTLRFVSVGNLDKVLLEIVGPDLASNGLLTDGQDDGVYRLEAIAIDTAGNRSGMTSATFNFDNLTPDLVVDNARDGMFVTGNTFTLTGNSRDNAGGCGVARVTVTLQSVDANGNATTLPIFREQLATLDPIAPGADNPRRNYTFAGDIRAVKEPTAAVLTVRSYDRASNYREAVYQVNLQTSSLRPPELSSPATKWTTSNPIVSFSWLAVPGAADYTFRLIGPNQDQQLYSTDGKTSFSINLAPLTMGDGNYYWAVASVDAVEREGLFSQNRLLVLDRERPRVVAVDVLDPSPEAVGSVNEGEVRFTVKFSEPMDTRYGLVPRIRPQSVTAPAIEVQQTSFDGSTWTGRAAIPETAVNGADYNGLAELELLGSKNELGIERPPKDLAGNLLEAAPHSLLVFEINTGPAFRVGLFQNPIDRRDVILIVKGFSSDGGPAARLDESMTVVVKRTGFADQNPAMIRLSESSFRGTFRVDSSSTQPVRLEVTGRDRLGNSSSRTVSLNATKVDPSGTTVISSADGALQLKTLPNAVAEAALLLAPEPSCDLLESETVPAGASRGLVAVGSLQQFYPSGFAFKRDAELRVDLDRVSPAIEASLLDRVGIYRLVGGAWKPVACKREGNLLSGPVGDTGPYGLFADVGFPVIASLEPAPGTRLEDGAPEVRATVVDAESGIDPDGCSIVLDGVVHPATVDEATGLLRWRPERALSAGEHTVELRVTDRAGNKTSSSTRMLAPAALAFAELVAYPNPARTSSTIRYRLTQAADDVTVRIYDAAGRRVASLHGPGGAGLQLVDWPLFSDDGIPVQTGVYLVKAEASGAGRKISGRFKIAVLR